MRKELCTVFMGVLMAISLGQASASAATFIGGPDWDTSDKVTVSTPANWDSLPIHCVDGSAIEALTGEAHNWGGFTYGIYWMGEKDNRNGGGTYLCNPGTYPNAPQGTMGPNWIRFDFDQPYPLDYVRIWNCNDNVVPQRSLNQVVVEYSVTGGANPADWTRLGGAGSVQAFPIATASPLYTGFSLEFPNVMVKSVVFTGISALGGEINYGASNIGLSEVRFYLAPVGVQGIVALEGYTGDNTSVNAKFVLTPNGGGDPIIQNILLNADGSFLIKDIPVGTYDLTVTVPGWLKATLADISVSSPPTVLPNPIVLHSGDIDGDGEITSTDLSLLLANMDVEAD